MCIYFKPHIMCIMCFMCYVERKVHTSVNMNKYFSEINWSKEFFNLDADQCYNRFLEIYNYACERFIPVFKSKSKRKRAIWMNNELMKLIKLKREMWFKCLNCRFQSIDIVNDYKKIRTLVKEKVKIAVRDYEKDLVLNVKENPKRFYSYINKKIKVKDYIKALIDSSGNVTSDSKCIANILNSLNLQPDVNKPVLTQPL